MKKKTLISAIAIVLVICCAVGGTLAWLTSTSADVKNTFTVGKVKISLDESKVGTDGLILTGDNAERTHANAYKIIPGAVYDKDPTVAVEEKSEACWLFVEITEGGNDFGATSEKYITYGYDSTVWTPLGAAYPGVYYTAVNATDAAAGKTYNVLANKKIEINEDITETDMDAAAAATLDFKAYAIQQAGFEAADYNSVLADAVTAAWTTVKPPVTP